MDVEMEAFEITDWDLQNEFRSHRTHKRPSKKQQIYGIWADDSDDEIDSRPSFGKEGKGGKDYSAPINFISGGFKQPTEKKTKVEDPIKDSSDEDEEETKEEIQTVYRDFSRNKKQGRYYQEKNSRFAGVQAEKKPTAENFGGWEKHTKGIGHKLLLQMGYEPGKGLGKDKQGIVQPIQAKKREGKGALGLYGPEHVVPPSKMTLEIHSDDDEKTKKKKRESLHQWKKKQGDEVKVKYVYKTVEEVKSEGTLKKLPGDFGGLSSVKVIDMTGPEQRVLSGYHQIHQQHSRPVDLEGSEQEQGKGHHFALPELEHNLELLVDLTEQAILRNDRELRLAQDRIVSLQHEDERLSKELIHEKKQTNQIQDVLSLIDSFERDQSNPLTTLNQAANAFRKLKRDFYEEYKLYELSDLAVTIVFPLVNAYLAEWIPLQNPRYGLDLFKTWKDILEMEERSHSDQINNPDGFFDPYHQLVWEIWMPYIRRSILSWRVRQPDQFIEILENWLPLIPSWIMENVLTQLVYPCLEREVCAWNPVTDTMPIHAWHHPWLPLMSSKLEPLYAPIRHKLAAALTSWHPSDCSAKLILEPWRRVFSRGTMESFVVTNILPKLLLAMQGFVINPHQQHLDVWNWVMTWEDLLPLPSLVSLLEKTFFNQFLQVLCNWLTHTPNYEEVTKWYMGWKSMCSANLLAHPIVRDYFKKALDVMNQAVTSPHLPLNFQMGPTHSASIEDKNKWSYEGSMSQVLRGASSAASLSMSFKDLIQKKAEEMGVLFAPLPNRYQEGKQVYRFANSTMYLDRGVIFVFNEKTWVPTSLQSLLDRGM